MDDNKRVTTPCSGGDCIVIEEIGNGWFRMHSTVNRHINIAVTGDELRAFIIAVKAGVFDGIVGLPTKAAAS